MSLHGYKRRALWLLVICSGLFILLGARLFYLQLWRSELLSRQAVEQRFQSVTLSDGRGDIQDRHGRSLLDSRSYRGLLAFPSQYRGREKEIISALSRLPGIEQIAAPPHGMQPFWIGTALSEWQSELVSSYPGLLAAIRSERYGPGILAEHLVGYIKESEGTGAGGIELSFDQTLSPGRQKAIGAVVDGKMRLIPGLGYREREAESTAKNVLLTLDRELQREVERIMEKKINSGAVVVLDPSTGDILALASRPRFHPAALAAYLNSSSEALLNHALCAYQPGSLFKTVVAAAALEEGITGLFNTFNCSGGITVEGLYFPCSYLHRKEKITFVEAFASSCNSVFIDLALQLEPGTLNDYARRFGLGESCKLPLWEQTGAIPSADELAPPRVRANSALGQGKVMITPLQAAAMMAALANGGRRVYPRLVLALTDGAERETARFWQRRGERILRPETVNQLKYLLHEVIAQGTARAAAVTAAPAAAKTGTAESGRFDNGTEKLNYWIAGFYPLEGARAAVAVFADDLREGTVQQVFGEVISYIETHPDISTGSS